MPGAGAVRFYAERACMYLQHRRICSHIDTRVGNRQAERSRGGVIPGEVCARAFIAIGIGILEG